MVLYIYRMNKQLPHNVLTLLKGAYEFFFIFLIKVKPDMAIRAVCK